jgi:hypothetical protein
VGGRFLGGDFSRGIARISIQNYFYLSCFLFVGSVFVGEIFIGLKVSRETFRRCKDFSSEIFSMGEFSIG